jgi:hypothetical protein
MLTPAQLLETTPHVGDWGTVVQLDVVVKDPADLDDEGLTIPDDLTTATLVEIIFDPPGAPAFVRTAQVITPTAPARIQYVWLPGDIRTHGRWRAQPHVVKPGADYRGRAVDFDVLPNLGAPTAWRDPRAASVELYLPQASVVFT